VGSGVPSLGPFLHLFYFHTSDLYLIILALAATAHSEIKKRENSSKRMNKVGYRKLLDSGAS